MKQISVIKVAFLVLMSAMLSSCHMHHKEKSASFLLSEAFSRESTGLDKRWWRSFQYPDLNKLVKQVLSDNLDLKQAWAKLDQARALADQARASWHPRVTAEAGAGRNRVNIQTPTGSSASYNNRYFSSVGASYETDLWGRISSLDKAAQLDVKAFQGDLESMAMSLAAEVAETWFSIIEQKALLGLVRDQVRVNKTYLKLVQLRYGQGLVSALDVYQQRQQAAGTRAQIPVAESKLRVLFHKLSVLLGQPPRAMNMENKFFKINQPVFLLPDLPKFPSKGLPSELLISRPDIQAAKTRIAAADHRAGAAAADRFPSLRFSASGGFRVAELSKVLENLVWDILGSLSGTVWDGGRKSAEVRRTRAVVKELAAKYAQTVLDAFQEVENALVREKYQHIYLEELQKQVNYSKKSLEEARTRYLNGLDDYLRVLTSLKSLQSLEQTQISAKRQLLSYRIQVYRSLGGAWEVGSGK